MSEPRLSAGARDMELATTRRMPSDAEASLWQADVETRE